MHDERETRLQHRLRTGVPLQLAVMQEARAKLQRAISKRLISWFDSDKDIPSLAPAVSRRDRARLMNLDHDFSAEAPRTRRPWGAICRVAMAGSARQG